MYTLTEEQIKQVAEDITDEVTNFQFSAAPIKTHRPSLLRYIELVITEVANGER